MLRLLGIWGGSAAVAVAVGISCHQATGWGLLSAGMGAVAGVAAILEGFAAYRPARNQ